MKREEAHKLNQQAKQELRKQVAKLKGQGRLTQEIADITGLTVQAVNRIWKRFQEGGSEAIKMRPKGRLLGEKRRLNPEREKSLQRLMMEKTPEQLRFNSALWTRAAVAAVSWRLFGVDLPLRTISHYLKRWGFTVQKTTVRAYERNPEEVKEWLSKSYPAIHKRAKEEEGEIHWEDETGVEASDYVRSGLAPKTPVPVVSVGKVGKTGINMISSITNQGKVRFMLYEDKMTAGVFIKFLGRLIKDAGRKVFLIVDNLRVHHSPAVQRWLSEEKNGERLEIFYLPSYSPELNPDERLSGELKGRTRSGHLA